MTIGFRRSDFLPATYILSISRWFPWCTVRIIMLLLVVEVTCYHNIRFWGGSPKKIQPSVRQDHEPVPRYGGGVESEIRNESDFLKIDIFSSDFFSTGSDLLQPLDDLSVLRILYTVKCDFVMLYQRFLRTAEKWDLYLNELFIEKILHFVLSKTALILPIRCYPWAKLDRHQISYQSMKEGKLPVQDPPQAIPSRPF